MLGMSNTERTSRTTGAGRAAEAGSSTALDLYLVATRAEALSLLDAAAPYARLVAREDVPPVAILAICRHQVETLAMVVQAARAGASPSTALNAASIQVTAWNDAASYVRGVGYDAELVHEAAAEWAEGRPVNGDPAEYAAYLAWFVAEAAWFDSNARVLAMRCHLPLTEAVGVLRRYETLRAATAAADYATHNGGTWLPSVRDVRSVTPERMAYLSKAYPETYGAWRPEFAGVVQ